MMRSVFALLFAFVGWNSWAEDNYLRLYFMPSAPVHIEWDSPRSLVDSTISASFNNKNHPISHVDVEVFCAGNSSQPTKHIFAGATSLDNGASSKLLFDENIGLSILVGAWPGRLEDLSEIDNSLSYRGAKEDFLSALTFTVSDQVCQRLIDYHTTTVQDSLSRLYGFAARPLHHEGAGCSAFAVSFLEVAGLLTDDIKNSWTRKVTVPLSLMTVEGQATAITVREILNHPDAVAWVSDLTIPHMALSIYDPDLMHEWVTRLYASEAERAKFNAQVDMDLTPTRPKIRALKIDAAAQVAPVNAVFTGSPDMQEARPGLFIRNGIAHQKDGSFSLEP